MINNRVKTAVRRTRGTSSYGAMGRSLVVNSQNSRYKFMNLDKSIELIGTKFDSKVGMGPATTKF